MHTLLLNKTKEPYGAGVDLFDQLFLLECMEPHHTRDVGLAPGFYIRNFFS